MDKLEHRTTLLQVLESDYQAYGISHLFPEHLFSAQLRIALPMIVFTNIADLFFIFLQSLKNDSSVSEEVKVEQTMKILLYSLLFTTNEGLTSRHKPFERVLEQLFQVKLLHKDEIWNSIKKARIEANLKVDIDKGQEKQVFCNLLEDLIKQM